MKKRIDKEAKKVNHELDNATKKLGQEAIRGARDKLGIGHNNQQDNTELTGTTPEEHHEN
ncbi:MULTISPECIES: hypothetical protein [spotted fever group]|uniref:Uncharacterized protein n=1 Tax=Rickettsia tamurae subsp. buchneri TaxID=1462938 RepID=A0A8E0WLH1_9RICK|nr:MULTISPECIES: hypothetical protein [spotted fever group]KDO02823.1 hypothetical protein REISMN_04885 [Rickettsia tamurae subsp. buchneri]